MRFHFGPIPGSPDFTPDGAWKPLREPVPWLMQLIALPIGFVSTAFIVYLWFFITPLQDALPALTLATFFFVFAGVVVFHELIHAAAHPMAGRSSRSILGFWPSSLLFYAHFDGELSRNRFVAILLLPLLVISVLPLLVAASMQAACSWMAFISSFNALMACCDIFGAGMVLSQIPAAATVRNQGWRTYWKEPDDQGAAG